MAYSSVRQILDDDRLTFDRSSETRSDIRDAIENRLKDIQSDSVERGTDEHRLLIEAREFLGQPYYKPGALMRLGGKNVAIFHTPVPQEPIAPRSPRDVTAVMTKMADNASVAATKASQDFRRSRSLPFAGLGVLVAAIWGSRVTFGVKLPRLSFIVWSAGAVVLIAGLLVVYNFAALQQHRDEKVLRRLYDPAAQGDAVGNYVTSTNGGRTENDDGDVFKTVSMLRHEYRHILLARASRDWYALTHDAPPERERKLAVSNAKRLVNLSRVDIDAALDDASNLALDRLVNLGVLEPALEDGWREVFIWKHQVGFVLEDDYEE